MVRKERSRFTVQFGLHASTKFEPMNALYTIYGCVYQVLSNTYSDWVIHHYMYSEVILLVSQHMCTVPMM